MALCDYVVRTISESIPAMQVAREILDELGYQSVWLKMRKRITAWNRRTRTLEESLLPGYLFVKFDADDEAWMEIPHQRGVLGILGSGPLNPTPLRPGAVDRLRAQFAAGEFLPRAPLPVSKGDQFIVEIGALAGKIGTCDIAKGERIEAMMAEFAGRVVLRRDMVRRLDALAVA